MWSKTNERWVGGVTPHLRPPLKRSFVTFDRGGQTGPPWSNDFFVRHRWRHVRRRRSSGRSLFWRGAMLGPTPALKTARCQIHKQTEKAFFDCLKNWKSLCQPFEKAFFDQFKMTFSTNWKRLFQSIAFLIDRKVFSSKSLRRLKTTFLNHRLKHVLLQMHQKRHMTYVRT